MFSVSVLLLVLSSSCLTYCHQYLSPFDSLEYSNAVVAIDDSITLSASPDTLNTTDQWVTVTWSGVEIPDSHDWIGVYTQPQDGGKLDPSKQAPVKYQYCKYSLNHLSKGEGSFKFYMVNLRVPYIFAFLKHDFSKPTLSAVSNPVNFINPNEPLQGHLMLTEDPTQIKLMWVTRDSDSPEVKYSVGPSTAIIKILATSMTYKASDMCGSPATDKGFIDPGQLHTAVFKNLKSGQVIFYQFGDDKYGWSKMYNFTVPPAPNATATTRIIAYGDMGQGQRDDSLQPIVGQLPSLNTTRLVQRDLHAGVVDLVVHIGDVSYARGYAAVTWVRRSKTIAYSQYSVDFTHSTQQDMGQTQQDDSLQPLYNRLIHSLNTTRLVMRDLNTFDLVVHIGDVSYAIGYAAVWDEFFDQIQPIATHVPYMVSVGNHERDFPNSGSYYDGTDSGGECGVPYGLRFPMPRPSSDQDWYTFQVGSAQFVLMSTEHNFTTGSIQYDWISKTLAGIDRSKTPWVIFSGHRPMYIDSTNDNGRASDISVADELILYIEPLLMKYKVDLALWGHHHSYQRTCAVYQHKCTPGATVHAVIGMAGQGLSTNIKPVKPDWIEMYDIVHYGYSRITTNQTALMFEYVRDDDGRVHDSVTLTH